MKCNSERTVLEFIERTRPYLFAVNNRNMSNKKNPAPFHITLKQTVFVIKIYMQLVALRSAAMFYCGNRKFNKYKQLKNGEIPQLLKAYVHIRENSCTLKKLPKHLGF